jgi:hypothetical protein
MPPHKRIAPAILTAWKQKATGNPDSKSSDNAPKIIIKLSHQSMLESAPIFCSFHPQFLSIFSKSYTIVSETQLKV